jgi:hypothetical protein
MYGHDNPYLGQFGVPSNAPLPPGAQAFYGEVPVAIEKMVYQRLDKPLAEVTRRFMDKYSV